MLRPAISAAGSVGEPGAFPFSAITEGKCQRVCPDEIGGLGPDRHTSVKVSLLGELVVGVAVRVNRAVQLLECHQRRDELIVCVQETTEPLLRLHMMNLQMSVQGPWSYATATYIAQQLPP